MDNKNNNHIKDEFVHNKIKNKEKVKNTTIQEAINMACDALIMYDGLLIDRSVKNAKESPLEYKKRVGVDDTIPEDVLKKMQRAAILEGLTVSMNYRRAILAALEVFLIKGVLSERNIKNYKNLQTLFEQESTQAFKSGAMFSKVDVSTKDG